MAEMFEACTKHQHHEVWRLARVSTGKRLGPKGKRQALAPLAKPTKASWVEHNAKPGKEGGQVRTKLIWTNMVSFTNQMYSANFQIFRTQ